MFSAVPVGQEYRDLIKLIPGVQYTQDAIRGPSAGGNGQDNTYQFDGVDVSLPLFGTLSAEPSTHDIDQVSIVRGGATAVGFNRSGGFKVNTTSKRGTDEFHGQVSYQTRGFGLVSRTQGYFSNMTRTKTGQLPVSVDPFSRKNSIFTLLTTIRPPSVKTALMLTVKYPTTSWTVMNISESSPGHQPTTCCLTPVTVTRKVKEKVRALASTKAPMVHRVPKRH